MIKREAIKWLILTPPPIVSNLLEVHSALIKVYIPWYNYRYFEFKKWAWVSNFCRCVLSKHKAFSCVLLDQGSSDYGEEQHTAHLYRNPPELHSFISLELLIRHIPNILNIFKGLLSSGEQIPPAAWDTTDLSWKRMLNPMAQRKITFFQQLGYIHTKRSHPKITGRVKLITFISPMPSKYCKNWEQAFPFISKGRKRALTH